MVIQSGFPGISIDYEFDKMPSEFELFQNYPNPFNPTTTIKYHLPQAAFVNLSIFNLAGQLVAHFVNDQKEAGTYTIKWDASQVPSGVYLYWIKVGNFSAVKKCVIIK